MHGIDRNLITLRRIRIFSFLRNTHISSISLSASRIVLELLVIDREVIRINVRATWSTAAPICQTSLREKRFKNNQLFKNYGGSSILAILRKISLDKGSCSERCTALIFLQLVAKIASCSIRSEHGGVLVSLMVIRVYRKIRKSFEKYEKDS